jgi:hypothetical protein
VRELLGHRDVATTMIYTHVLNGAGLGCGVRRTGCEVVVVGSVAGRVVIVVIRE